MTQPEEPWQKKLWDMGQRVAVQVAEKPLEQREAAFAAIERVIRDMVVEMKVFAADKIDDAVNLQMQLIRETVEKIDVGGSPQGGNA